MGPLAIGGAAALVTLVFAAIPRIPRAYGYGAALALVLIDGFSLVFGRFGSPVSPVASYVGGLLDGASLVYVAHRILGTLRAALYAGLLALIADSGSRLTDCVADPR